MNGPLGFTWGLLGERRLYSTPKFYPQVKEGLEVTLTGLYMTLSEKMVKQEVITHQRWCQFTFKAVPFTFIFKIKVNNHSLMILDIIHVHI